MKKITFGMLLTLSLISPLQAEGLHIYQDPIPLGSYVSDYDDMLDKAVARNHWVFERQADKRFARLNYKTYLINVELVESDKGIAVTLLDAKREGCTKSCDVDMKKVTGWLVKLRRAIAYELTLLVRDDALRRAVH
ncbi:MULTISPECIES: hypothetical protein [Shewanella]|uniref:Uncharacterized protein n=1 Tax=Shewanella marisflavi TaxID=260364 RepID=A0ABX5WIY5_9GAMM|nr:MULTISPECIES: hypothetical protein [Shewanella]QDF74501.1 hypothetical protein FGA12_04645 [Shewanella marisflavi]